MTAWQAAMYRAFYEEQLRGNAIDADALASTSDSSANDLQPKRRIEVSRKSALGRLQRGKIQRKRR